MEPEIATILEPERLELGNLAELIIDPLVSGLGFDPDGPVAADEIIDRGKPPLSPELVALDTLDAFGQERSDASKNASASFLIASLGFLTYSVWVPATSRAIARRIAGY